MLEMPEACNHRSVCLAPGQVEAAQERACLEGLVAEGVSAQGPAEPGNGARAVVQPRVRAPPQQAHRRRVADRAAQVPLRAHLLRGAGGVS